MALPRTPDLVVALLAVLKAGAAYLPLDTDHPADRLAYMVSDAGARLTLHPADLADLSGTKSPMWTSRCRAVRIYTSGSAKGVVVPHDGVGSLVATAVDRLGVCASSRAARRSASTSPCGTWHGAGHRGAGRAGARAPPGRRAGVPVTSRRTA